MITIEISSPHSYSTSSIHTIGLSRTVWPQYTTRQQNDRNRSLCYSTGGLTTFATVTMKRYRNCWKPIDLPFKVYMAGDNNCCRLGLHCIVNTKTQEHPPLAGLAALCSYAIFLWKREHTTIAWLPAHRLLCRLSWNGCFFCIQCQRRLQISCEKYQQRFRIDI